MYAPNLILHSEDIYSIILALKTVNGFSIPKAEEFFVDRLQLSNYNNMEIKGDAQ